jgi:hypothetical protein
MKILCVVTDTGLAPKYDSDREEFKKLKRNSEVVVEIKKGRNIEFHKKYFALLKLTYDNFPEWLEDTLNVHSIEDLRTRIKIDLGLYEVSHYGNQSIIIPKSIAFDKMDETEFEKFYNMSVNHILKNYLKGVSNEQIEEEIWKFL